MISLGRGEVDGRFVVDGRRRIFSASLVGACMVTVVRFQVSSGASLQEARFREDCCGDCKKSVSDW